MLISAALIMDYNKKHKAKFYTKNSISFESMISRVHIPGSQYKTTLGNFLEKTLANRHYN